MSEYSMSRPVAGGTTERRNQKSSYEQITTDAPSCQALILDCLGVGAENATKTADLLKMTGISSPRELRRIIAELRASGALILSGLGGYYIPASGTQGQHEAADFVRVIESKAIATLHAADPARRFLHSIVPGQTSISSMEGGEANG